MEIWNYPGGWEAMGHQAGMGIQEKPFSFGWHPLPHECLLLVKVPNIQHHSCTQVGALEGVVQRDRRPGGSSGPPQGHASPHRAEVAMVSCQATWGPGHPHHVEMATAMDVSCQATLGLWHPLHTGDGHSDKEEIAQESPPRKP